MDIKPIRTEQDYQDTLTTISSLMTAAYGTYEGDRLDILTTLVEAWEREHYPMATPDPIEAIKFAMEQRGLEVKDLIPMIGQTNRVYEVLSRKRPLTLNMIRRLHKDLGIPAESLLAA